MDHDAAKGASVAPWPKGIGAITLFVEDLEATKQFYLKVFGLPVVFEDNNSSVFKFGNTLVNLLKITAAGELVEPAKWHLARPDLALCSPSRWTTSMPCAQSWPHAAWSC